MNHGDIQYVSFGVHKPHYSNQDIVENQIFSVNILSRDHLVETDYLGIVTGKKRDKPKLSVLNFTA